MLHPNIPQDSSILDFFHQKDKVFSISLENFKAEPFGPGWAWDDYHFPWQSEMSSFPVYGNLVFIKKSKDQIATTPSFFKDSIKVSPMKALQPSVKRSITGNQFLMDSAIWKLDSFSLSSPMDMNPKLIAQIMEDTFKNEFEIYHEDSIQYKPFLIPLPDTLYKMLMQNSDNFIAEQLLLLCSDELLGKLDLNLLIDSLKNSFLSSSPQPLTWFDGSGLSRYNKLTPSSVTWMLDKIYKTKGMSWIRSVFPAGGTSGTIQNFYQSPDHQPYVYAKTGTLRNVHCLSGYIRTKTNKWLIFSFMHNNFKGSSKPIKDKMGLILSQIYEKSR